MPENQPPENDPFADLYGRLPDPRTGARSARTSRRATDADDPAAQAGLDASAPDGGAPPSRRAAREARRAQTGPTAVTDAAESAANTSPGGDPRSTTPAPDAASPAATAPRDEAPRRGVDPFEAAAAPDVDAAPEAVAAPVSARPATDAPASPPADARPAADAGRTTTEPAAAGPRRAGISDAPRPGVTDAGVRQPDAARRVADAPRAGETSRGSGPRGDAPRSDVPRATLPSDDQAPSRTAAVPQREPVLVGAGAGAGDRAAAAVTSSSRSTMASGSLEQLFTGESTTHDIGSTPPRPPKKRRRIGGWIALGVVVLLVGGLTAGGFALWNTYGDRVQAFLGTSEPIEFEAGQATGEARVTIVSGDTGASVSPKLFDAGITKASDSLYTYMVDNAVAFTFQPGVYKLQQQMTSEAVLTALRDPANRLDNSVQLREGLTLSQSLDLISEQVGIARADLDAAVADPSQYGVPASTLEGWIFPATYEFDDGVTAQQVIERMVQRTIQSLDTAGVPVDDRERILIVASIIEREARSSEDFYKVSRVIENRLQPGNQETFGKLEMDSTVQYGAGEMGSGSVSTSTEARNSDNPWNTYMYPGLPVGPIANPGDLAIDAAMKPADGPWLYFVTVNLDTGETVFTSTYSEHQKAVAQWQAWCAANPDGGC